MLSGGQPVSSDKLWQDSDTVSYIWQEGRGLSSAVARSSRRNLTRAVG